MGCWPTGRSRTRTEWASLAGVAALRLRALDQVGRRRHRNAPEPGRRVKTVGVDSFEGRGWLDWWANASTLPGSVEISVIVAANDHGWTGHGHLVTDDDLDRLVARIGVGPGSLSRRQVVPDAPRLGVGLSRADVFKVVTSQNCAHGQRGSGEFLQAR